MSGCGYVLSRTAFNSAMTHFPEMQTGGYWLAGEEDEYAQRRRRLLRE